MFLSFRTRQSLGHQFSRSVFSTILSGCIALAFAGQIVSAQDYQATAPVGFQGSGAAMKMVTPGVAPTDVDGDGWDDLWLNLYGRVIDLKGDPRGDYDEDGVSNFQEMRDFTNPLEKDRDPKQAVAVGSAAVRRQAAINAARVEPLKNAAGKAARLGEKMAESEQASRALSVKLAKAQADERAQAVIKAKAAGLMLEGHLDNGGFFGITRFEGGMPQSITNNGLNDATVVTTDQLWPGGALGYSLTGAGRTIGLWDGGIPLSTHQEFNDSSGTGTTRITVGDGASVVADHATGVAGVLAATGFDPDAIGMSFESPVLANDFTADLSEMAALSLSAQRLNNHSYNFQTGWGYTFFTGLPPAYRVWYGDIGISTAESYQFGRYDATSVSTDSVVVNLPYTLPVWSSGNDRLEAPNYSTVTISGGGGYFYTFRNGVAGFYNGSQFWAAAGGTISYNSGTEVTTFTPAGSAVSQIATLPNDGGTTGYDTLPNGYSTAKNSLAVGAIDFDSALASFSSSGPADDGRLKPEIVAVGVSVYGPSSTSTSAYSSTLTGTSFSAPSVTGSLNLISQFQEDLWGGKEPFLASTLRAIAAHTATDLGSAGPDYRFGYGRLDSAAAATLVESNYNSGARSYIKEVSVPNNGVVEFPLKAAGGGLPIKVTIAWTDPAGTAQTATLDPGTSVLVNNLDVRVFKQSPLTEYKPWTLNPASPASAAVKTATNDRDNLEQVVTPSAVANALYTVTVTQKSGTTLVNAPQRVSIVIAGITPLPKPFFQVTNIALDFSSMSGSIRANLTWNSVVGQWYRIQKSSSPGGPWVDDSGDINALKETTTAYSNYTTPVPSSQFWRVIEIPPNPFGLP